MNYTTILLALVSSIFVNASEELQDNCWAREFNMPCCKSGTSAIYKDQDGIWGVNNGVWCGIVDSTETTTTTSSTTISTATSTTTTTTPIEEICWSSQYGYDCCPDGTEIVYENEDGPWGIIDHHWCGIIKETPTTTTATTTTTTTTTPIEETCWSLQYNYNCCPSGIEVAFVDEEGIWGFYNDDWCGIIDSTTTTTTTTTSTITTTTTTTTIMPTTTTTTTTTTTLKPVETCWSLLEHGYPCCPKGTEVLFKDENGAWGYSDDGWCGIDEESTTTTTTATTTTTTTTSSCDMTTYVTVKEKEYVTEIEQVTVTVTAKGKSMPTN